MNIRRLRTLCVEIYKTLIDLNQSFMNNIFKLKINGRKVRDKYKLNLDIPKWNQKTYGYKSLKVLGPKIWNNLPYHAKSSENLDNFKSLLKNWDGNLSKCNLCKKMIFIYTPVSFIQFALFLYWKLFTFNIIYIYKKFFYRITCKNVTIFLFLKFQLTYTILTNKHFIKPKLYLGPLQGLGWSSLKQ